MQPVSTITARPVVIPRSDIDTDQIIPAAYLSVTTKEGLGQHLFSRVKGEADFAAFVAAAPSPILVAQENFGCGSSREHAAWALADYGVRVVLALSFADIFYGNALKNGILPVVVSEDTLRSVREYAGEVTVDLPAQEVRIGSDFTSFAIDPFRKECLMLGTDELSYLLTKKELIDSYDASHAQHIYFDTRALRDA